MSVLVDELSSPSSSSQAAPGAGGEARGGARALCQLALGLALAALKRAHHPLLHTDQQLELLDQDEALVDAAIDGKVV